MSSAVAGVNKKRKKPDTKPQSQINKCLNEKRRREQENIYIEELAELISASFADMSSLSVKPDKCAILQETVNQIRHIKQQEAAASTDAVQQGEVSSSKPVPCHLSNQYLGPLLLEAVEGFLFVVNTDGRVDHVTENVSNFIKYTKEEVEGNSIYNYIHHGDHARFSSTLLPVSVGWTQLESPQQQAQQQPRNRTFNCRFLIKPPDDQDETMEEKQQRVSKYENMQISSAQLPGEKGGDEGCESGEIGPRLLCVARRIPPNEKHIGTPIEQFTMKLDTNWKIIGVDTSGVSANYSQYLNKDLLNMGIEDLCHRNDINKLSSHLKEAISVGQSTSGIYRLRVSSSQEKYVHVQTKSKLFKPASHEPDFIMATHSIIGDNDLATDASSPSSIGGQSSSSSVGGPLMPNINGGGGRPGSGGGVMELGGGGGGSGLNNTPPSASFTASNVSDLGFDFDLFPSSTWDIGGAGSGTGPEERVVGGSCWPERSESRASLTPAPSPLNPYSTSTHPSPVPPSTPSFHAASSFPFSPLQETGNHHQSMMDDSKEPKEEDSGSMGGVLGVGVGGMEGGESARLRNLLMNKRPSTDSEDSCRGGSGSNRNKDRILKGLLNQDDEDQSDHCSKQAGANNMMLLKLLNEKSDDDDVEARLGLKKQHELLQQLLKEDQKNQEQGSQSDDSMLKCYMSGESPGGGGGMVDGVGGMVGINRGRKRPSEEGGDESGGVGGGGGGGKRVGVPGGGGPSLLDSLPPPPSAPITPSASSGGNSKLWEKNKMLASLLAKQPPTPTPIPPVPKSIISATPQDHITRVIKPPSVSSVWAGPGGNMQQSQQQQQVNRANQPQQQRSPAPARPANIYTSQQSWDSSDPILSDLLDQVIEVIPEPVADSPALMNMINSMDSPKSPSTSFQLDLNEKMAINAIQKSLMQCETAVKVPVYNSTAIPQGQQFPPPPPIYQQRPRFQIQGQLGGRQPNHQFNLANQQQQQLLLQRKVLQQQQQQQQQKQRLLQQQQQQQLLIPSNAAAPTADPGIHNIDSLINNTVAPNVSLQRSSSVPDSQLSPVGVGTYTGATGNNLLNSSASQISPGQRQPYSPQPFSPVNGGINSFQNTTTPQGGQQARLSPSGLSNFQQAQLSPRVSQGQQVYSSQPQGNSWSQQQANRISLQQQQNPMLNAQLTGGNGGGGSGGSFVGVGRGGNPGGGNPGGGGGGGSGGGGGGQFVGAAQRGQLPPVRSLTSPGSRQSPFPPELSPTAATSYQFRLQRTISAPQATTQLPGGGGSLHHYRSKGEHLQQQQHHHHQHHHQHHQGVVPLLSPPYPHHHHHPQLLYLPESPGGFCFDQSSPLHQSPYGRGSGGGDQACHSGGNNGMTEYVRQELRAKVGARTVGSGPRLPLQIPQQQHVPQSDLDALGLSFDITPPVSESPKMWSNMSDLGNSSPQPGSALSARNAMEEVSRSNDQKSSLLQKLLSE